MGDSESMKQCQWTDRYLRGRVKASHQWGSPCFLALLFPHKRTYNASIGTVEPMLAFSARSLSKTLDRAGMLVALDMVV
jgi:hypothetical protein